LKPRVVILRAAGTNCDLETAHAFEMAGAAVETVHINQFTRGLRRLSEFRILAIPGGFTYGDDVSAGRILANEMRCLLQDQIREFVASAKLVIGICNGFQALVKAGILPVGTVGDKPLATLTDNLNGRFQCRWTHLLVNEAASPPFLHGMDGQVLEIPIAHGEGRYVSAPETMQRLRDEKQIALQYCGPNGELGDRYNVNGSALHAAAISAHGGRVLGLMPHPERCVYGVQHPRWTREGLRPEGQGLAIFRNAVRFCE